MKDLVSKDNLAYFDRKFFCIENELIEDNDELIKEIIQTLNLIGYEISLDQLKSEYIFFKNSSFILELSKTQKFIHYDSQKYLPKIEGSFIINDEQDWPQLKNLLLTNYLTEKDNLKKYLINQSENLLKKISLEFELTKEVLGQLELIEMQLFKQDSIESIQMYINENEFFSQKQIKFLNFDDLTKKISKSFLVLLCNDSQFWGISFDAKYEQIAIAIFSILHDNLKRFTLVDSSFQDLKLWETIFSHIKDPVVIITQDQEITFYNSSFVSLNLTQSFCRDLQDNQQIQIAGQLFRINKKKIISSNETVIYFIAIKDNLISTNTSSEELGIVCSSLAHELNNPLAGILAAISLLEMDEGSDEFFANLKEMKLGATRCKQLVETFLGFSRANQNLSNSSSNLKQSFNQALELMRFRIIENNINFEINYVCESKILNQFNPSVMAMLFYLLLGEIVTAFSHYNLVAEKLSKRISLEVTELNSEIRMKWEKNFRIDESVKQSKLIQHLVESQNARAEMGQEIKILFN